MVQDVVAQHACFQWAIPSVHYLGMKEWQTILRIIFRRRCILYSALLVLMSVILVVYWQGYGGDLASNLLAEAIGICITVFILDVIISFEGERRNYKLSRLAFAQICGQLERLAELVAEQQKSASGTALSPVRWDELFTEEIANTICASLDPDSPCSTIYERPTNWQAHNTMFADRLRGELDAIIDKYLAYIPEDLINNLEHLKKSAIFEMYRVSKSLRASQERRGEKFQYLRGLQYFYMEMFNLCFVIRQQLIKNGVEMPE
ncbi:MAG: hypothetical protein UX57_C0004G0056 [Candidatus Uhrbacteria bacterium GW2011_GWE2_46_68]|uniref:Uncharacterized protein n=2 Tax=Candidatus Uhriibacteriota TaxID=1752732 RepID=A0A0G1Q950_9BACT|nr:MAG: hypothetical protein UX45_C0001G0084 [Candidatus Uhrbacteria bacterium GW2011_GWF2_46_218]KKU41352.1 MAG: hypothetical protein UX57_C0004G0056 [Candidatus Uhrbacteria bacterium GW2011_GWE2_46_68]